MIAVRKANYAKQQWDMSSPGIVIGHNFTDYFVSCLPYSRQDDAYLHPNLSGGRQKAPTQVRLLYGDLASRIFSTTDLLPYTQDCYAVIARGADEWKTVAIPSRIL